MQCKRIMEQNIQFVGRDDEVASAAQTMRAEVGFLPVCDPEDNKIVGTLTDRDIAIRLVAQRKEAETPVSEIMSTAPIFCPSHDNC